MRIRRILIGSAVLIGGVIFSSYCEADDHHGEWAGAGWYQIRHHLNKMNEAVAGPIGNEDACETSAENDFDSGLKIWCEYYNTKDPSIDWGAKDPHGTPGGRFDRPHT